jgi:hypothetical protein
MAPIPVSGCALHLEQGVLEVFGAYLFRHCASLRWTMRQCISTPDFFLIIASAAIF